MTIQRGRCCRRPLRRCRALPRCGELSTEREFPSDKVYRRDDRGVVGVESFNAEGPAFFVIHAVLDALNLPRARGSNGWRVGARDQGAGAGEQPRPSRFPLGV